MKPVFILVLFLQLITDSVTTRGKSITDMNMTANQKPIFSFGIVSDVQYCDCDNYNTRFYRKSASKLREALSELSGSAPAFVINLGDLIDRDYASFDKMLEIFEESGITTYHCLGNHDYTVAPGDVKKVSQITQSKTGYYSFKYGSFRFVVLNGTDISTYAATPAQRKKGTALLSALTEQGAINAYNWNGAIGSVQMEWLVDQLNDAAANSEMVFIVCHFPVFPEGTHNLFNSNEILNILRNYKNVIAWFNGHNHDGGYGNTNMIHFVTFRGMVETESTNSFAFVEVYSNKIWIMGSGREKSQILAY